jgi:penicillin-binding protein 4B
LVKQTRIYLLLLCMTFAILLLGARLLWLQASGVSVTAENKLVERSVAQRSRGVVLDNGRGRIVDRKGEALAGIPITALLMLPASRQLSPHTVTALAGILGANPQELTQTWKTLTEPTLWKDAKGSPVALTAEQAERVRALMAPGILSVEAIVRYPNDATAKHLVGFVTQWPEKLKSEYASRLQSGAMSESTPVGASGLELAFDRFLQGVEMHSVANYSDRWGNPMPGIGIRRTMTEHEYYPLRLVTTIDRRLQQKIERLADESGMIRGSVVVLDANTADVVAMVSRPDFEPTEAGKSADSLRNRALIGIPPGSVFKSFIAAVALEEGVVKRDERFFCSGEYGKYGLTCWKKAGHGDITFEEGFARSCNIAFATVAERLDGETLERYAASLGLTGRIGWSGVSSIDGKPLSQLAGEEAGKLSAGHRLSDDGGVLAQTGIGQRDVRLTPLAAANWVVTLLHYGSARAPRAVSQLTFADGTPMESYDVKRLSSGGYSISAKTAETVLAMMRKVVEDGTGGSLQGAEWELAGKSGTAQDIEQGKPYVHQWFVGYGPAVNPKYAVSVVFERRPPESSNAATTLFRKVMDVLAADG